jgi:prefoldin subunit 5
MTSIERELGNLQARIETVETEIHALRGDMRELRDALLALKNSWRTLIVIVSLATSMGASLEHILPLITGTH